MVLQVKPCSRCHVADRRPGQRYCRDCHAAWMNEKRTPYAELTEEQKIRHRARVKAQNAVRAGKLERQPCQTCGTKRRLEMHHADYSKPLEVVWLCFRHHRMLPA